MTSNGIIWRHFLVHEHSYSWYTKHVNNNDQFTRKNATSKDKFPGLVNLVLTTTKILNFTNKLMALQWEDQHLQLQMKFTGRIMNRLQYLWHYILKKFGKDLVMTFIPFLGTVQLLRHALGLGVSQRFSWWCVTENKGGGGVSGTSWKAVTSR